MAKRTLCQASWCTQTARQAVSAAGTGHQLLVCYDTVHERWAKGQINEDFPGRAVEIGFLDNDEPDPTVIADSADDDADGM